MPIHQNNVCPGQSQRVDVCSRRYQPVNVMVYHWPGDRCCHTTDCAGTTVLKSLIGIYISWIQSATLATSPKPESSRRYVGLVKASALLARQSEPLPMPSPQYASYFFHLAAQSQSREKIAGLVQEFI